MKKELEWTLFSSVQSLSRVQLFVTPWTSAGQASLSITNSQSPPKPIGFKVEVMMQSQSFHVCVCVCMCSVYSLAPSAQGA